MIKFSLALFILLVSLYSAAGQTTSTAATWQVQKYDLSVQLPPDPSRTVTMTATLSLKNISAQPANRLTLRVSPLAEVTSVKINGSAVEPAKSDEKVNAGTSLQRIATSVASVAPNSQITAVVEYKLTLKENSALASLSPVGSQFLSLS